MDASTYVPLCSLLMVIHVLCSVERDIRELLCKSLDTNIMIQDVLETVDSFFEAIKWSGLRKCSGCYHWWCTCDVRLQIRHPCIDEVACSMRSWPSLFHSRRGTGIKNATWASERNLRMIGEGDILYHIVSGEDQILQKITNSDYMALLFYSFVH